MKMDDKFIIDRYNFELQRKEHLNGSLTFPVALLTAIGTALLAMVRSFTSQELPVTLLFLLLVFGAAVCLTMCAVFLFRAYHNQTYEYLPLLRKLRDWQEESAAWLSYVEDNGGNPGDEESFEENFEKRIINAADRNTQTNDERSKWMHIARRWLMGAFVATAIAGIPYGYDQARAQNVEQLNKAAAAAAAAKAGTSAPSPPGRVPSK